MAGAGAGEGVLLGSMVDSSMTLGRFLVVTALSDLAISLSMSARTCASGGKGGDAVLVEVEGRAAPPKGASVGLGVLSSWSRPSGGNSLS